MEGDLRLREPIQRCAPAEPPPDTGRGEARPRNIDRELKDWGDVPGQMSIDDL